MRKTLILPFISLMILGSCGKNEGISLKGHSWEKKPKKGQLYMVTAGEYAFEKDYIPTCIIQKWGENNYLPPGIGTWFEVDKNFLGELLNIGFRTVFLPNGKEDLPYLDLIDEELHSPPPK